MDVSYSGDCYFSGLERHVLPKPTQRPRFSSGVWHPIRYMRCSSISKSMAELPKAMWGEIGLEITKNACRSATRPADEYSIKSGTSTPNKRVKTAARSGSLQAQTEGHGIPPIITSLLWSLPTERLVDRDTARAGRELYEFTSAVHTAIDPIFARLPVKVA